MLDGVIMRAAGPRFPCFFRVQLNLSMGRLQSAPLASDCRSGTRWKPRSRVMLYASVDFRGGKVGSGGGVYVTCY
uniref:Uncharacterized protein n=1 Tax=Hyaloperonospora arabidopsidis (strain Emoy2) TaxID=559515 RepID=M4B2K0_HYAAE